MDEQTRLQHSEVCIRRTGNLREQQNKSNQSNKKTARNAVWFSVLSSYHTKRQDHLKMKLLPSKVNSPGFYLQFRNTADLPVSQVTVRGGSGSGEVVSLLAQMVNNLPTMQDTWVWSLGQEDPLEKEISTHSSILAWKIPWTEEPWGREESDTTEWLTLSLSLVKAQGVSTCGRKWTLLPFQA